MSDTAWLFAGQGAQCVGMGLDVAAKFDVADRVLREADAVLDFNLRQTLRDGPAEELARTDVCQPAIVAVSLAIWEAAKRTHAKLTVPAPAFCAGLSLGEYTALVAAGALDAPDAIALVRKRGRFMQEACDADPGTMFSVIGLEDARVEQACAEVEGDVWPANYNSPGQVVVSGRPEPTARAAELCKDRGAKMVVQLNVAGAFHTPLMEPAAQRLATELDNTDVRAPRIPVVSNVTGEPVGGAEEIRRLLKLQLTQPVRWAQSVRHMIDHGVSRFYEFGPGKVLSGLLRRIERSAKCTPVNGLGAIEKL